MWDPRHSACDYTEERKKNIYYVDECSSFGHIATDPFSYSLLLSHTNSTNLYISDFFQKQMNM